MTKARDHSLQFFDAQFRRQIAGADYTLNPFEQAVLPYLFGDVLDMGCGLGNLAMAAAEQGCAVTALDGNATAVENLARRATEKNLSIEARQADLRRYASSRHYDCVVSIGLLMFFGAEDARASLAAIKGMVRPGGVAAINVLIEGTTFMEMFDPDAHYLFGESELLAAFAGWKTEYSRIEAFPAPGNTIKRFCTLIARQPGVLNQAQDQGDSGESG